jgi:hypothetical protein
LLGIHARLFQFQLVEADAALAAKSFLIDRAATFFHPYPHP